jgi:hypothetical protein
VGCCCVLSHVLCPDPHPSPPAPTTATAITHTPAPLSPPPPSSSAPPPPQGVDKEHNQLVVAIIDFIRTYTWDKQLETWVKSSGILGGAGEPSL